MHYKNFIIVALIGLSMSQWSFGKNQTSELGDQGSEKQNFVTLGKEWLKDETAKRLDSLKQAIKINTISSKPPTHFLFLSNTKPPAYATTAKKTLSEDPFIDSFMRSARKGSKLFWTLLTTQKAPEATKLSRVLELINFIFFAALPKEINKLTFDNLTIDIHASPDLITKLDTFFRSYNLYLQSDTGNLFQLSSNIPWYSIHLRSQEGQKYRDLWLGSNKFKSFGIAMLADDLLEIRPHADSQGRPGNFANSSNVLDIALDDLISAYLILNADNKKAKEIDKDAAGLMGALFANMATKKTAVNTYLIEAEQKYIAELNTIDTPRATILTPYLQSLLWEYTQAYAKKTSHNLAPINPSDEQLKDSLAQYSLSAIIDSDIEKFRKSAQQGAKLAKELLLDNKKREIKTKKSSFEPIKHYVQLIVDLNNFFYTLAIFGRDDGVGPATVTFQIAGNGPFNDFIYGYLELIRKYKFPLGTEQSMSGANPFAYYRKQSHHFKDAWGMEMRWLAKGLDVKVTQEPQPYLFPSRWQDIMAPSTTFGPQFHLLIGKNPDLDHGLFFKWEEHGLYGGTVLAHAKDFALSVARKQPLTQNLFGLTPDDAPQNNKERVPSIIAKTISKMEKEKAISADKKLQELAKKGIATLYNYCEKKDGMKKLVEFLERTYDHPDIRWGNEIVIAPERDDSILWIDYFTTSNSNHKELYNSFSLLKREIIAFATAAISTQEAGSAIEIEMPSLEKIKEKIEDVLPKIAKNQKSLPEKVNKYLSTLSEFLEDIKKLDEEELTAFIEQYGRIMFDLHFSQKIADAIPLE